MKAAAPKDAAPAQHGSPCPPTSYQALGVWDEQGQAHAVEGPHHHALHAGWAGNCVKPLPQRSTHGLHRRRQSQHRTGWQAGLCVDWCSPKRPVYKPHEGLNSSVHVQQAVLYNRLWLPHLAHRAAEGEEEGHHPPDEAAGRHDVHAVEVVAWAGWEGWNQSAGSHTLLFSPACSPRHHSCALHVPIVQPGARAAQPPPMQGLRKAPPGV